MSSPRILAALRAELPPLLTLAVPVVLAELGWMLMGTVDTVMVGRLGAEAIATMALAHSVYHAVVLFGMGLLLGLDTLVSQAFGARDLPACHRALSQGLWLAVALTPLLWLVLLSWPLVAPLIGVNDAVRDASSTIIEIECYSILPLLLYSAQRRYLQSMNRVRIVTFTLVSANLINVVGNWLLIYGHAGFPAMGVAGSAWATVLSRFYFAIVLALYIVWREMKQPSDLWHYLRGPRRTELWQLLRLGGPVAAQLTMEVGVFSAATVLISRLTANELAAHQIALNVASITFMVPLGVSSAGAVRVGQAIGAGLPQRARAVGWMAVGLGASCMALAGLMLILVPDAILRLYTTDAALRSLGIKLLAIAALFQLFDGTQTTLIGVLRGAGDTRTPMLTNLVGYWVLGLPIGWWLCFRQGLGAEGLWFGLCIGLIFVAVVLLTRWSRMRLQAVQPIGAAA